MFCTDPAQLAQHPLTEGLRIIKEDGKTNQELAIMYKEEGNEWIKKKSPKELHAARDQYTYALEFVTKAIAEHNSTTNQLFELQQLQSIILSNRAQSALLLQNYGECLTDANAALSVWPDNVKAHYRKCKALFALKRFTLCLQACDACLHVDGSNKDILLVRTQCEEAVSKLGRIEAVKTAKAAQLRDDLKVCYELAQRSRVKLQAPESSLPPQLQQLSPHLSEEGTVCWSMLLLYPQYNKMDVVQSVVEEDMLAEYLAMVLPEENCPPWDDRSEYTVSRIVVYLRVDPAVAHVTSVEQWVEGYFGTITSSTTGVSLLEEESRYVGSYRRPKKVQWLECHLGVSVLALLQVPRHVLIGGVLHLVVFPREGPAHVRFMREARAEGDVFGQIDPMGRVTLLGI